MEATEGDYVGAYQEFEVSRGIDFPTIQEYWSPDFSVDAYPDLDYVSALEKYVEQQRSYGKAVRKAYELRTLHYQKFIKGKKIEEPGHRNFRKALKSIAVDCETKTAYWAKVCEDAFQGLVKAQELVNLKAAESKFEFDLDLPNPDVEKRPRVVNKPFNPKSVVKRPPLSLAEQERRKTEYRIWKELRSRREDELIQAADLESQIQQLRTISTLSDFGSTGQMTVTQFYNYCVHLQLDNVEQSTLLRDTENAKKLLKVDIVLGSSAEYDRLFHFLAKGFLRMSIGGNADDELDFEGLDNFSNYTLVWSYVHHSVVLMKELASRMAVFLVEGAGKRINFENARIQLEWVMECMLCKLSDQEIMSLFNGLKSSDRRNFICVVFLNVGLSAHYAICALQIEALLRSATPMQAKTFMDNYPGYFQPRPIDARLRKKVKCLNGGVPAASRWRDAVAKCKAFARSR